MAIQIPRRVAKYSAGGGVFSLAPGEEQVFLVFNNEARRYQWIPDEAINLPEYADHIEERIGDGGAIAWFNRPTGFGTPFGKAEDADGNDPGTTAIRETAEETGVPQQQVYDRMSRIQYTERPNRWSRYSNTVYFVNGNDFPFNRSAITDPLLERELCGFYPLNNLPIRTNERNGIYQASLRRIIALLLQANDNRSLILRAGGSSKTDTVALVRSMLADVHYHNIFSRRMIAMLCQFQRTDIVFDRLINDRETISSAKLAKQIARNLIMWISGGSLLDQSLDALRKRCNPNLFPDGNDLGTFFQLYFQRKDRIDQLVGDREGFNEEDDADVDEYGSVRGNSEE